MPDAHLLHELIAHAAARSPLAGKPTHSASTFDYEQLHAAVQGYAGGLVRLGLARGERVAIYLDKRFETVIARFGAPAAGGMSVPVNPLLKPEQVAHILRDFNVRVLVTSPERLQQLGAAWSTTT
jgi:acyl-CoA synthetase (AMP-forming)/AMP-acid ligase II